MKQGEANEPLELVAQYNAHPEMRVRIVTRMEPEVQSQLIQLLVEHKHVFT